MSIDRSPSDEEMDSLSRMARETADFYEGLATLLDASSSARIYHFDIKGLAALVSLGRAVLPDGDSAVILGTQIIGQNRQRRGFAGCSLKISHEKRTVAIISI